MYKTLRRLYYFFLKICKKLKGYWMRQIHRHPVIHQPKLAMTLLVKNEIDVVEENIRFHRKMGVDTIIVTDNYSTDGTYECLQRLLDNGMIDQLFLDREPSYNQTEKVDRMIRTACDNYHADWIMNVDADEFWFSRSGDLKTEISAARCNVMKCRMVNVYPDEQDIFQSEFIVKKTTFNKKKYTFRPYNLYNEQYPKVLHRSSGYQMIAMGNHSVEIDRYSEKLSKDIIIYHFCIRGKEHFSNKMINGAIAAMKMKGANKKAASHWKYFYNCLVVEGKDAEKEYETYIGKRYFFDFVQQGTLEKDKNLVELYKNIS